MTPVWRCVGGCDRIVSAQGAICGFCPLSDPKPTPLVVVSKSEKDLRFDIWHHAYRLALGTKAQQVSALETLSHLVSVLQHETMNPKPKQKETK